MFPVLLVAAPAVWLAHSLGLYAAFGVTALLAGPLAGVLPLLSAHALLIMLSGIGVAVVANMLLGTELLQNQRCWVLLTTGALVFAGAVLWLVGVHAHPQLLWGYGHWLAAPVFALLAAAPCGTVAVVWMLKTETILETLLVLGLFIATAWGAHQGLAWLP